MEVLILHNHDTGIWKDTYFFRDTEKQNPILQKMFKQDYDENKVPVASCKRDNYITNQVICIEEGRAYSILNKPDANSIAGHREMIMLRDSTYRLLNNSRTIDENNSIDEIIYTPDYENRETDCYYKKKQQRSRVGGNADIFIENSILKKVLCYIYSQSCVYSKNYLVIKVPQYFYNKNQRVPVDYDAYCRAIIAKILYTLPIEMREGLSFATSPNEEGMKKVGISFEPENNPIKITEDIYGKEPVKINIHQLGKDRVSQQRLNERTYLGDNEKRIISACVDNPELPSLFYKYCLLNLIIDPTKGINQGFKVITKEGLKEISFIDCFNQFMIEQSKDMNKDIEPKT